MNLEVNWDIQPCSIGCKDYNTCILTTINTNDSTKEIWSVSYSYICNYGVGCFSSVKHEYGIAYVSQLSEWLKNQLLERLPDHKFQGYNFSSVSKA
jgi:hypothetical protein